MVDVLDSRVKRIKMDQVTLDEKFPRMMHYIISTYGKRGVPRTLLAKLCYFSDFDNYELYAESITKEQYRKATHGPLASNFKNSYELLSSNGKIKIEESNTVKGDTMYKCISIDEPNINCFSQRDLETIEWVIDRYGKFTPSAISEISHNDIPWVSTPNGEIIDYELVFYRNSITSVLDDEMEDCESDSD